MTDLHLARQEQLFSRNTGFLDTLANFFLVLSGRQFISTSFDRTIGKLNTHLVDERTINVPVSNRQGMLDSVFHLSRFRLPCAQSNGGNIRSRIQTERSGKFSANGHFFDDVSVGV